MAKPEQMETILATKARYSGNRNRHDTGLISSSIQDLVVFQLALLAAVHKKPASVSFRKSGRRAYVKY